MQAIKNKQLRNDIDEKVQGIQSGQERIGRENNGSTDDFKKALGEQFRQEDKINAVGSRKREVHSVDTNNRGRGSLSDLKKDKVLRDSQEQLIKTDNPLADKTLEGILPQKQTDVSNNQRIDQQIVRTVVGESTHKIGSKSTISDEKKKVVTEDQRLPKELQGVQDLSFDESLEFEDDDLKFDDLKEPTLMSILLGFIKSQYEGKN